MNAHSTVSFEAWLQDAERRAAMVGVKMTFPLVLCILPSLMAVVLGPAVVSIFTKIMAK